MTRIDRRDFLKTCGVAAIAGSATDRALAYFGPPSLQPAAATGDTLVVVFLRGAMDGLSLLPPGANSPYRADYEVNRISTQIPASGPDAALPLNGTDWTLHPRATALQNLFNEEQHLGIVVGAGQLQPNPVVRSHFEAQANLEFGFGGGTGNDIGWLTRHLVSGGLPAEVALPAASMGNSTAASLLGSTDAITMESAADFRLDTFHWSWQNDNPDYGLVGAVSRLDELWGSGTLLESAGRDTLESLALLRPIDFGLYHPVDNPGGYQPAGGANYDTGDNPGFGVQLRNVAQLVKLGLGLRVATIDLGNWDTHVGQGNPTQGYDWFGNQVQSLSDGLGAFYTDLAAGGYMQNVSVVVVSEFGRRVQENANGGTDHGYGNVLLALGGSVNGGVVYGNFQGLAPGELYQGTDVAVTTDYRQVISEALIRRLGNPNVYYVFPGYTNYAPLGIFQGTDLPPGTFDTIFASGFES